MMLKKILPVVITLTAAAALPTQAAIVFAENFDNTSRTSYAVSSTDLIQAGSPTLSSGQPTSGSSSPDSYEAFDSRFPFSNINDGSNSNTDGSIFELQDDGAIGALNHTITFELDLTNNTLGYDLSSIAITSNGTDQRVWQDVQVLVRTVGSSTFTPLFQNQYQPTITSWGSYSAQVIATENAGSLLLASGVDAIQFKAFVIGKSFGLGSARSSVFSEYDVVGTPTVPEPSALLLSALGGLFLLRRKR